MKGVSPDLILLDWMIPGLDGLEVCRKLKQNPETEPIPIIMLTAKGEESDIVADLELGADDYVAKPFSLQILLSRVKAVLRRRKDFTPSNSKVLKFSGLVIHPGRHEVKVDKKFVELTFTEFRILQFLAGRPGWVFNRFQTVDAVHG